MSGIRYPSRNDGCWVRIDSEILGLEVIENPHDLVDGQFPAGPWDEWGPMRDCYDGNIESWVEQLMDDLVAAPTDKDSLMTLYGQVPVPAAIIG